jgi:hypothetical protein
MDKNTKDPLYSDSYATTDFVWGQTLGEGKSQILHALLRHLMVIITQSLASKPEQKECFQTWIEC